MVTKGTPLTEVEQAVRDAVQVVDRALPLPQPDDPGTLGDFSEPWLPDRLSLRAAAFQVVLRELLDNEYDPYPGAGPARA